MPGEGIRHMEARELPGPLKVAILARALGPDAAAYLLEGLGSGEKELIMAQITQLGDVSPDLVEKVAEEFTHKLRKRHALPATTGLKKADLKQLQQLIGPIAKAWLSNKLQAVETLFEEHITADLLTRLRDILSEAESLIAAIRDSIGTCERALPRS